MYLHLINSALWQQGILNIIIFFLIGNKKIKQKNSAISPPISPFEKPLPQPKQMRKANAPSGSFFSTVSSSTSSPFSKKFFSLCLKIFYIEYLVKINKIASKIKTPYKCDPTLSVRKILRNICFIIWKMIPSVDVTRAAVQLSEMWRAVLIMTKKNAQS